MADHDIGRLDIEGPLPIDIVNRDDAGMRKNTCRARLAKDGYRAADPTHSRWVTAPMLSIQSSSSHGGMRASRSPPVLSRVAGADFEALLDRQSCGRAEHIANPQL